MTDSRSIFEDLQLMAIQRYCAPLQVIYVARNMPTEYHVRGRVNEDNNQAPAEPEAPAKPAKKKLLDSVQAPTRGRVVLYLQHEGEEPMMAHVCHAYSPTTVTLDVVDPRGHHFAADSVSRGDGPGQWRWPTRAGGES